MEHSAIHQSFFTSPYHFIPENHVDWDETPESHIYSADLPGVKKEEIRVEVEDSRYLIIRTEEAAAKKFLRKFRLPEQIDINGISAGYENGVLTVRVPRSFVRREFFIEPADLPDTEQLQSIARAA